MPGVRDGAQSSKKRKNDAKEGSKPSSAKRRAVTKETDGENERIQQLEDQIAESRKYYNNIVTLLSMLNGDKSSGKSSNLDVAVSLCRVFCRLLAGGHLNKPDAASEQDLILVAWLRERYQDVQKALISLLRNGENREQVCSSRCPRRGLPVLRLTLPPDNGPHALHAIDERGVDASCRS